MKNRLIWKDITRNKVVTLTTLLFVSVAAMLLSLAAILEQICLAPSTD